MENVNADNKCNVLVTSANGWHTSECGRPAKGKLQDGTYACGIHLNAEKKRLASNAEWEAEWEQQKTFHTEVKNFKESRGIMSLQVADSKHRRVSLSLDALSELLK